MVKTQVDFVQGPSARGGGGGEFHFKKDEVLVGNFEMDTNEVQRSCFAGVTVSHP